MLRSKFTEDAIYVIIFHFVHLGDTRVQFSRHRGLTLSLLISIRHQLGFNASKLDHLGHFTFFGDESAKLMVEPSSLAVWYRQDSTLRDGGIKRSGPLARPAGLLRCMRLHFNGRPSLT
jgi:hypothetical protein